jgi:hypothetical protein
MPCKAAEAVMRKGTAKERVRPSRSCLEIGSIVRMKVCHAVSLETWHEAVWMTRWLLADGRVQLDEQQRAEHSATFGLTPTQISSSQDTAVGGVRK